MMHNPFRYFNSSPEVIRFAVMLYVRYPLSLRQVEDLLFERGIEICYETVRYGWNRFGSLFAAEIRTRRVHHGSYSNWRWHLDEVFVRINGKTHYLWRAVDHEGEVLEVFVTKRRDRKAALEFLKRTMKRYGRPASIVTDRLKSYRAAMGVIGNAAAQTCCISFGVVRRRFELVFFLVVARNGQQPQAPNMPCTVDLVDLALAKNPPVRRVPAFQIVSASLLDRGRDVRQQHLDPNFGRIFVLIQVDGVIEVVLLNDRKPPLPVRSECKL